MLGEHTAVEAAPTSHHPQVSNTPMAENDAPVSVPGTISKGAQAKRDLHKRRGDSEFRSGNFSRAVKEYTLALSVDPQNALILSNRSAGYMQIGQPQKALEDAKICVLLDGESARGYARLAAAYYALKQWEPAIDAYEKTLQKSPDNTVARRDLKRCREQLDQEKQGGGGGTVDAENNSSTNRERGTSETENLSRAAKAHSKRSDAKEVTVPQVVQPSFEEEVVEQSTSISDKNVEKASFVLSPSRGGSQSTRTCAESETRRCVSEAALVTPDSVSPNQNPIERKIDVVNSSMSESKPGSLELDAKPQAAQSTPPLATHKSAGLSELSKQLRLLQATNDTQNNEIDRLERQLRILAELKGISVEDLRKALHMACEDEAHAELRSQVAILRSRLEASALASSKKGKNAFEKEVSDQAMANMQLRVGELEEMAETLRGEIQGLYQDLSREKMRSTKLQHTCDKQKKALDEILQEALVAKEKNEAQSQRGRSQQLPLPEGGEQRDSIAKETHEAKVGEARLKLQLERDRANLLEQQAYSREKEVKLLTDQYRSRFQVQDQRIADLEQQLSSLYAAFEMVEQEHAGVHERQRTLTSNLQEADEQVVRQLTKMESGRDVAPPNGDPVPYVTPVPHEAFATKQPTHTVKAGYSPEGSQKSPFSAPMATPRTPKQQQRSFRAKKSPVVPNSIQALDSHHVISGFLLKRDKNILKGAWKKRYFVLHGSNGVYHLSYSEKPKEKIRGTIGHITTGLSTVSSSIEYSKRPFVIVIRSNPQDLQAPVFYTAAEDCDEYDRWMSALTLVTTGKDSALPTGARSPQEQEAADHEVALRMQMEYMD